MDATTTSARTALATNLSAIVKEHAFSHYLTATLPQADRLGLSSNLIVSNWPLQLIEAYKATDVFWDSRMVETLKRTIMPVIFGNAGFARQGARDLPPALKHMFDTAGLRITLGFLLHDPDRRPYIVLFSGLGASSEDTDLAAVFYKTLKAMDAYTSMIPGGRQSRESLTARELDCIRWSAAGKISDEIATILDISIHTVNTHLKSAMRKLESANRMQAVATACRLRLI